MGRTSRNPEESRGQRKVRGRPARLSREAILSQAVAMLETDSLEALTMSRLAASLGAATMALYTYFPNRDALLEAIAAHVFSLFDMPEVSGGWREHLLEWLRTMARLMRRYPAVLKVIGWENRLSDAYIRVVVLVAINLRAEGLEGNALAFAFNWFLSSAMGLLQIEILSPAASQRVCFGALDALEAKNRQVMLELLNHIGNVRQDELLEFGFHGLLDQLERLIEQHGSARMEAAIVTHPEKPTDLPKPPRAKRRSPFQS